MSEALKIKVEKNANIENARHRIEKIILTGLRADLCKIKAPACRYSKKAMNDNIE